MNAIEPPRHRHEPPVRRGPTIERVASRLSFGLPPVSAVHAAFTALAALVVAAPPAFPGHDVPQHLAYVRLLAAFRTNPGALRDVYTYPDLSNVYATAYRVLASIAAKTSPEIALRLALVLYVVAFSYAIRAFVRASWQAGRGDEGPITVVLAPLATLNPVLCMGLIAYVFALPPLVAGAASAIGYVASGERRWLVTTALFAALAAVLHAVAGAALVLFLGLVFGFRRERRSFFAFGSAVVGIAVTSRVFGAAARVPPGLGATLLENMRVYGPVPGVLGTFRISFTHWLEKVEQVVANVIGPFPWREKVVCALLVLVVVAVAVRGRSRAADDAPSPRPGAVVGVRPACLVFTLVAVLAPSAVQVPDDLSLLDFRLITTATALCICAIPARSLSAPASRVVLAGAVAVVLGVWARQLVGTVGEVMEMVRLTDRLTQEDRLLALSMHDGSAFLDERNAVLHYTAVHHTARTGGVTSLFWGRFSPRLPIGYRPGREPAHPLDWRPWELEDRQLANFSHVVVRWPASDDDPPLQELAGRVEALRRRGVLRTIACDGSCCLFAVASKTAVR